ncbi:alpha/beta hydrolase [Nocardia sp. CDC159]|uniref:Alpha/beta hydrolase n=1 Tax=Nocardia pulmonis TaxID=2951408 RepID=A0A9X2IZT9_9NOCA|nr:MULTISPECIES: alpha/beta hydrolase [Nocardia]MCM6777054.1 alpha/beta hydrolase [Nocardia pulmonis]MCM6789939.1 alpha/beta hydrolase [Nocardia sp. CDC159]
MAILNSRAHRTFPAPAYQLFAGLSLAARTPGLRELLARSPIGTANRIGLKRYVRLGCFDDELLDHYVGAFDETGGRRRYVRFLDGYEVRERPELVAGLGRITCPTAVIWGDRDPYIPFTIAEDLVARLPRATLTRIAGADHYVMEERPDEVTAALLAWLE